MERKYNRFFTYLPLILALVLVTGMVIGSRMLRRPANDNVIFSLAKPSFNKVSSVINYIDRDYVDSVDVPQLEEEAIVAMLKSLDPHSQYFSAEELKEINEPLVGNFEGIGIEFRMIDDTITVMHVIAGGPSEKIGLRAGDRIYMIDDDTVASRKLSTREIIKKLKGERGTKVVVTVKRKNVDEPLDFTIIRDIIPLYSLDVGYMVSDSIGYIKISKFSATTPDEFSEAVSNLKNSGMSKLILDLRGNVGGYLKSAIRLSDEFLESKKLIVYTEGTNRPRQFAYATRKGQFEKEEVVILIDEGSASASEILAGAVQDNDRGIIIGRRSFGKGLVQEQIDLNDGSAIRLTVARYYTPTGRCIQKSYENGTDDYYNDFHERYVNGEMQSADSINFPDSLKYYTPGGKIVYGGGGIMPDVFVPIRTGKEFVYFNQLIDKGLIYRFAFDYADGRRDYFMNKYSTVDSYINDFDVDDELFNDFIAFAEEDGVEKDDYGIEKTGTRIRNLIKAFIGRNIHSDEAFYPIYNQDDTIYLRAIEELS